MAKGSSVGEGSRRARADRVLDFDSLPDEQLLEWFLRQGGEGADAAFRALVLRHGPMVLGVCRNVLREDHDAEDAFQATFLVLARKGDTIRDRRVLGRWLYEVAHRIAVRARSHAVRRRVQERQAAQMTSISHEHDRDWTDLLPLIHEEVNRLPANYRSPVSLCYLQGKTHEEAAQLLDWPLGTVKGRLSRARDLLRSRLSRRGVALSLALIGVFLRRKPAAAAELPPELVDSTVQAAMRVAALPADAPALVPPQAPAQPSGPLTSLRRLSPAYRLVVVAASVIILAVSLTSLSRAYAGTLSPNARSGFTSFFMNVFAPSTPRASCSVVDSVPAAAPASVSSGATCH